MDYAEQKALESLMEDTWNHCPPPVISLRSEYELGPKLGQGAFSVVKKIIRKTDGAEYALKICKPKSGWPTAKGEAKLLDYLRHPNIIKFERFYHKKGHVSDLS
jgi:serine/threonine protein kinase